MLLVNVANIDGNRLVACDTQDKMKASQIALKTLVKESGFFKKNRIHVLTEKERKVLKKECPSLGMTELREAFAVLVMPDQEDDLQESPESFLTRDDTFYVWIRPLKFNVLLTGEGRSV